MCRRISKAPPGWASDTALRRTGLKVCLRFKVWVYRVEGSGFRGVNLRVSRLRNLDALNSTP